MNTLTLVIVGVAVGINTYVVGRIVSGYWRDRRDRGDTGPDPDSGFASGGVVPGPRAIATVRTPGADPRVVEEPIRAWKLATLNDNRAFPFVPMNGGSAYGLVSIAQCGRGCSHPVPEPKCQCGFYARPTWEECGYTTTFLLLEVELYGRVMLGENGYRAEKQRVLAVWTSRQFGSCRQYATQGVAGSTVVGNTFRTTSGGSIPAWPCGQPARYIVGEKPMCARHAVESGKRFREYEFVPPDLGVEWRWIENMA